MESFLEKRKVITAGELRKLLERVPDETQVSVAVDDDEGYASMYGDFYRIGFRFNGIKSLEIFVGDNHE